MTAHLEYAILAMRAALREAGFFPKRPRRGNTADAAAIEQGRAAGVLARFRAMMEKAPPAPPEPLEPPPKPRSP